MCESPARVLARARAISHLFQDAPRIQAQDLCKAACVLGGQEQEERAGWNTPAEFGLQGEKASIKAAESTGASNPLNSCGKLHCSQQTAGRDVWDCLFFPSRYLTVTLAEKHIFTPGPAHFVGTVYNSVQILLLRQYTWLHKAEYTLVLVKGGGFGGDGQICWLILQSSVHKYTLEKSRPAITERQLWIICQQRGGEVWTIGRNISPNDLLHWRGSKDWPKTDPRKGLKKASGFNVFTAGRCEAFRVLGQKDPSSLFAVDVHCKWLQ